MILRLFVCTIVLCILLVFNTLSLCKSYFSSLALHFRWDVSSFDNAPFSLFWLPILLLLCIHHPFSIFYVIIGCSCLSHELQCCPCCSSVIFLVVIMLLANKWDKLNISLYRLADWTLILYHLLHAIVTCLITVLYLPYIMTYFCLPNFSFWPLL
jgi:hypothetical protein